MKNLIVFSLIALSLNLNAATPEDGWWWNSQESGRGFNIETQNGTTFIAGFLYDEAGNAIWYTTVGKVVDNKLVSDFVKFTNGQCIGCTYTSPSAIVDGQVTFTFKKRDTGTLDWKGHKVEIKRFNFATGNDLAKVGPKKWNLQENKGELFGPTLPSSITINAQITNGRLSTVSSILSIEEFPRTIPPQDGRPTTRLTRIYYIEDDVRGYKYIAYIGDKDATHIDPNHLRVLIFNFKGLNKIEGAYIDIKDPADTDNDGLMDGIEDLDQLWRVTTNLFDKYPHNFFVGHGVPITPLTALPQLPARRTGRNPQTGAEIKTPIAK